MTDAASSAQRPRMGQRAIATSVGRGIGRARARARALADAGARVAPLARGTAEITDPASVIQAFGGAARYAMRATRCACASRTAVGHRRHREPSHHRERYTGGAHGYDDGMAATIAPARAAHEPLWTRNYALTLASLHLYFLAWAMLFSTLPLYVQDARKWQIGWVVGGASGVASVAVRVWSGHTVDRGGRRFWMVWGAAATGALLAAHALTDDPVLLTPIRLLYGVAACFYTSAGMAMLADVLPPTRRGEGMAWYGVVYTATNVYGPWLGLAIAGALGLRAFFVIGGGVLLACALTSAWLHEQPRPSGVADAPRAWFNRAALPPTWTFMSLAIAFSVLPAFLVLYATQRELGNAGVFFFVLGLALVAARWVGGTLADRYGRTAVIVPGLVLGAGGMALVALASSATMLYLAAPIFGVGFGLGHTGLTILTMDRAREHERGAAMATFALAWDIGTLGAFVLGFVGDAVDLRALFGVAAALPVVGVLGYAWAARTRESRAA